MNAFSKKGALLGGAAALLVLSGCAEFTGTSPGTAASPAAAERTDLGRDSGGGDARSRPAQSSGASVASTSPSGDRSGSEPARDEPARDEPAADEPAADEPARDESPFSERGGSSEIGGGIGIPDEVPSDVGGAN